MRLFLIRHAQSANNARPEEQRVEDPAITELGHRQAAALAQWLEAAKLTRLMSSPFRRSLETTEHIRRRVGLQPEIWVDLHEQGGCYRGYQPERYEGRPGMTHGEIAAEFPDYVLDPQIDDAGWWKSRPYESQESARLRARRLMERTVALFGGTQETVAYVMHADFKRQVLMELFAATHAGSGDWPDCIYNTAVTTIHIRSSSFLLDQYNSIGHLHFDWVSS